MYWHIGKRMVRASVCLGLLAATAGQVGCAHPRGPLFETGGPLKVWPAPPAAPRIKLIGTIADSGDLRAGRSGTEALLAALRGPRPPIRFSGPQTVAVHGTNLVAIADASGATVHILDLGNRGHTVVSGFDDARFEVPVGVTWAGSRLFVTDAKRGEIIELDAEGRFHRRFGGNVLSRPVGIAYVAQRDRLYVVDGDAGCLKVFDLAGILVETIGKPGSEPGAFHFPTHICANEDRLVVADTGNFRVQLLDLDGRCLRTIGQKGDGAGDFALPKGVAIDSEGHIYVVDAHFENVQVFDQSGRLLMAFGMEGSDPGQFSLPAGVTIDANNRIWVSDSGNRRVQVFAYMGATS